MGRVLSNDCKWVFNEACLTLWCHAVVHFEVKMSRFSSKFSRTKRTELLDPSLDYGEDGVTMINLVPTKRSPADQRNRRSNNIHRCTLSQPILARHIVSWGHWVMSAFIRAQNPAMYKPTSHAWNACTDATSRCILAPPPLGCGIGTQRGWGGDLCTKCVSSMGTPSRHSPRCANGGPSLHDTGWHRRVEGKRFRCAKCKSSREVTEWCTNAGRVGTGLWQRGRRARA